MKKNKCKKCGKLFYYKVNFEKHEKECLGVTNEKTNK